MKAVNTLGAFALVLVLVVAQALFGAGASGPSEATAAQRSDSASDVLLRVRVDRMAPRVVESPDEEFTITATVTNVGDRTVSDIVARVQVGERLSTAAQLAQALAEPPPSETAASGWMGVSNSLGRGDSATVTVTAPVSQLGLHTAGVYPLLLNVNGTPAYGGAARLAAVDLLVPVVNGAGGGTPAATSLLWPLTARQPKVVSARHGGPVVLSDDVLADELAAGGRLDSLVSAAESRRDDPELFESLCFAVDPDLLETVAAMSKGYLVRTGSGTTAGRGKEDARRWLDELRALVANHCVVEIPYADADLSALTKVDSRTDLVGEAVTNGPTILNLLNLEPRQGVLWPRGSLTPTAARAVADAGTTTVIASSAAGRPGGTGVDTPLKVLSYDAVVAAGFGHASARRSGEAGEQPDVAAQNAVAAVALRGGLGAAATTRPLLVAPPHDWNATGDELSRMLDSLTRLRGANLVDPAPLDDLLDSLDTAGDGGAQSDTGTATPSADVPRRNGDSVPSSVVSTLGRVESAAIDLQSAMSVDPTRQVEPVSLIQPLHNAVLRATSHTWRSPTEYRVAAEAARKQVRQLGGQVTVSTPGRPVSLASGSSPLPVTLSNDLPVEVKVRIELQNSPGLRPSHVEDAPLAANSRVSLLIPADTLRSGRFVVTVSVTTPGGTTLGEPARMELMSTEFGVVMVVLTATAGAALVLLSGRRIYRRVKTRGEERG